MRSLMMRWRATSTQTSSPARKGCSGSSGAQFAAHSCCCAAPAHSGIASLLLFMCCHGHLPAQCTGVHCGDHGQAGGGARCSAARPGAQGRAVCIHVCVFVSNVMPVHTLHYTAAAVALVSARPSCCQRVVWTPPPPCCRCTTPH
jgi:hypothetical protein